MIGKAGIFLGGLIGGVTALIITALNYIASQAFDLPRLSIVLFDWFARILPGGIITLVIDSMMMIITRLNLGPTSVVAKQIEQGLGIFSLFVLGILFGISLAVVGRNQPDRLPVYGVLGGLVLASLFILIQSSLPFPSAGPLLSIAWVLLACLAWGWVLGRLIQIVVGSKETQPASAERRRFLYLVGVGSATILVTAAGISLVRRDKLIPVTGENGDGLPQANADTTSGPAQSPPQAVLDKRFQPSPGVRPELTSNADFYRIDINSVPPSIDGTSWRLQVGGLVQNPLELTIEDIRARQAFTQAITLECISNRLAGDLISTSLWTGVRLKDILDEAGLQDSAREIYIESYDGFYESVPLDEAMDDRTLLVYEMNGEPLPQEHGYPLRIYIPNHFGMKQPKWITHMDVIDHEGPGYWVDRGWSEQAIPPTTSVIDTMGVVRPDAQDQSVPVGGIAYSGARGISKVEVQIDDGPWEKAELRTPPLSPLTWVQWRYVWKSSPGEHNFRVRAYDGGGEMQPEMDSEPHPNGATGVHSQTISVPE